MLDEGVNLSAPMQWRRRFGALTAELHDLFVVSRAGMVGPSSLLAAPRIARVVGRYGMSPGTMIGMAAARHGRRVAFIDDEGSLTFDDLETRSNAVAHALLARGVSPGTCVGILCRNHRGFLDILLACGKVGVRTLLLNTDFAGPQLADVCRREGVQLIVLDDEFVEMAAGLATSLGQLVARGATTGETLESYAQSGETHPPPRPTEPFRLVALTSGTTGTPSGVPRHFGGSLAVPAGILSKIPYRSNDIILVAAPFFHSWGLLNAIVGLSLGATIVTRPRFDPETALRDAEQHQCTALAVVPIMLQRILALGEEALESHDISLRIIACAGSQLTAELGRQAMDTFGDVVYNLYGSTEVAYSTIATPDDLRAAPGCAGRPPYGTTVKIFDDHGHELPAGKTGRIFVGNRMQFTTYTDGGTKEIVDGLMSSGDVGHFDDGGRLFVDGRDDDMIVSGGENVFPREVEELLVTHPAVGDAAVFGVPDDEYGQRLCACVVLRPGATLTDEEVRTFVKQNLARYKVPRHIHFLDELPRNPSGKVLIRDLAELTRSQRLPS